MASAMLPKRELVPDTAARDLLRRRAFSRPDPNPGYFEMFKMIIGLATIVPVRIGLIVLVLGLYVLCVFAVQFFSWGRVQENLATILTRVAARALLLCLGFVWISKLHEPDYPLAPVVVANHVSIVEILHLLSSPLCPSFLAKSGVFDIPCIGWIASKILRCIPVDRENSEGSAQRPSMASRQLIKRFNEVGHFSRPIAIFPEGTTTNGAVLLRFRKGAFLSGLPVQPVVYQFPYNTTFIPTFESIGFFAFIWRMLAQPFNQLMVTYLPRIEPNEECRNSASVYRDHVEKMFASALGVPIVNLDISDKRAYHSYLRGRLKAQTYGSQCAMLLRPNPDA